MTELRLEELTAKTITAANSLTLKPGQEAFVRSETFISLEYTFDPAVSWPRVVMDGDTVVGYLMATFDESASELYLRAALWRLHVAAEAQGRGVGRFAVNAFAEEARSRGFTRVTSVWPRGERGPGSFFERVGFVVIGETPIGEPIGALEI